MARAFRIATVRPADDERPDWGGRITSANDAARTVVRRARRSVGRGYKMGERGEDLSRKLTLSEVARFLPSKLADSRVGDVWRVKSLRNGVVYLIRTVEHNPTLRTVGNDDVDRLYTYAFRDGPEVGQENWGVCSRRPIAGTSIPTQHCPWKDMGDAKGPGSNAIDLGGFSVTAGWKLARDLAAHPSCGKVLFAGHAWTPESGWILAPGIGHFDHIHAEGRHARPPSWSLVRPACP